MPFSWIVCNGIVADAWAAVQLYDGFFPGQARLYLAKVITGHASAEQWQSVSGNGSDILYEQPTMTCFQLDEAGAEQNRFTMPLPVLDRSLRWADGIDRSRGALRVGLPVKGLDGVCSVGSE